MALKGGCLCGNVRYEIDMKPGEGQAANCHCSMCRKQTGAAFFPAMVVPAKKLKWINGENQIGRYKSSAEGVRLFCKNCGSTLRGGSADPNGDLYLAMGTLEDDPGVKPSSHMFVGSKAPWYDIADNQRQFKEFPS